MGSPVDLGLSGKACIVTGATSGIGAEVTRMLVDEGARVLLVAREQGRLDAAASNFEDGTVATIAADVTDPDAGDAIVAACVEAFGTVDVLVNNAGTMPVTPLDELTDEDWQGHGEVDVVVTARLL